MKENCVLHIFSLHRAKSLHVNPPASVPECRCSVPECPTALRWLVIRGSGGQGAGPSAAGSSPPAGTARGLFFSPRTTGHHRRGPRLPAPARRPRPPAQAVHRPHDGLVQPRFRSATRRPPPPVTAPEPRLASRPGHQIPRPRSAAPSVPATAPAGHPPPGARGHHGAQPQPNAPGVATPTPTTS